MPAPCYFWPSTVSPVPFITETHSSAFTQDGEAAGTPAQESVEVWFSAFGSDFELRLEPNDLFASKAQNIWIRDEADSTETPTTRFYKGHVVNKPHSWVRLSIRNGILDGMIRTEEDIYFIEPGEKFAASAAHMVIYRLSDTRSDWGPGSCALDHPQVEFEMSQHAAVSELPAQYELLVSELQQMTANNETLAEIEIGVVADYSLYQEHGASTATHLHNILNQVDGVLRAAVGLTLKITQTVIFTSASVDPFSTTTSASALLNEFSSYKGDTSSPIYGTDLAHLFTKRDFAGSTIGIAWLGTLCSNSFGAGLSQDYTTDNKSLVLLTVHEIGHNLSAPHDNQQGSACESTPFGFAMNPWISTSLNLQYSDCSKGFIATEVVGASCLAGVSGGASLTFSEWNQVPFGFSSARPGVTVFDTALHLFIRGTDGTLYSNRQTGESWDGWGQIAAESFLGSPYPSPLWGLRFHAGEKL